MEELISKNIPAHLLKEFCTFLEATIGLHVPEEHFREIEKKLPTLVQALDYTDSTACIEWLMKAPLTQELMTTIAHHLVVKETYFFRDAQNFAVLEKEILPSLIKAHAEDKHIRIWCAACATGEEPYSVAILLHRLIPNLDGWQLTILGTDLNQEALHVAQEAEYGKWALRSTPPEIHAQYFIKSGPERWKLAPEICKMVKFLYLNLVQETYPDPTRGIDQMDLILCNNVLIYFPSQQIQNTVRRLTDTLAHDGWLCVAAVEAPYIQYPQLTTVVLEGLTFFQKEDGNGELSVETKLPVESSPSLDLQDRYEQSLELYKQGEYQKVIDLLENSDHLTSKEIALLVYVYANQQKLDRAREWCERALQLDELDAQLYCLYGSVLQSQGNREEAIQALQKALYIDPNFVAAHFSLGILYRQQGDPQAAGKYFYNALQLIENTPKDAILPGLEGLTAGRVVEIIQKIEA